MSNEKSDEKKGAELEVVGEGKSSGQYDEYRKQMLDLMSESENKTWDLGMVMHEVYTKSMYLEWGFKTFKEYIETELGFDLRTAQYHIGIQKWFATLKPNIQKWARDLGWTKCRMLLSAVTNENAAEWKAKVAGKSVGEIKKLLDGAKQEIDSEGTAGDGSDDSKDERPKNMNFKLFPAQYANVDRAIAKAKEMANSDKTGHALDLMSTEFIATNIGVESVQDYFKHVEENTGVALIAYDHEKKAVVYGADLIEQLEEEGKTEVEVES